MAGEALHDFRESWLSEINSKIKESTEKFKEVPGKESENISGPSPGLLKKGQPIIDSDGLSEHCKNCKALQNSVAAKRESSDPHLSFGFLENKDSKEGRNSLKREKSENKTKGHENNCREALLEGIAKYGRDVSKIEVFEKPDIKRFKSDLNDQKEDLLGILIADINETVSLPFFDLELPREIAIRIFSYLDIKDLGNCAMVSKQWNILSEDDLLWHDIWVEFGSKTKETCVMDRTGWKSIVKDCILQEKQLKKNWKERICQISELEYEKGGILYATLIFKDKAIAGYANGLVKIWDIFNEKPVASVGSAHNESETNDYEAHENSIECVCMNDFICAAGYSNGEVHVWQNGHNFPLVHRYQTDAKISCLRVGGNSASIISSSGYNLRIDIANENGDWGKTYLAKAEKHINDVYLYDAVNCKAVVSTSDTVEVHDMNGKVEELEKAICAEVTCIYCTKEMVNVCITPLSYSVLDGYRVKQYCIEKGKLKHLFKGPHCRILCVGTSETLPNSLVVGCSDKKIRIHDSIQELPVMSLSGLPSIPCSLQIDDWKIIAGDVNGFLSVWDWQNKVLLWQTRTRHPVRLCQLYGSCLVTASLPTDKNPRATLWYADDLIQHRRYRGSIRIYNFSTANNSISVPDICQSDYDALSGYNFNINLSTPYDHI